MTNKIQLTVKQEAIVSFQNGALLVLASAGSGKTRVLTERIKHLVDSTKRKILAITFTNKASEEIKERLNTIDNIEERLFIGTFHSFCCYVLENHGNIIGYQVLPQVFSEADDRLKIIEDAIVETPTLNQYFSNLESKQRAKFKANALDIISKIKREVILDDDLEKRIKDHNVILLYYSYRDLMSSLNAIDFDDLLFLTYKLFINSPKTAALYRRNFEYICIDEAQDLNKAQYMVIRALTGNEHRNIMMVGDPKQSIYGFNGSSSVFMQKSFVEDYAPKIIELNDNFRSSRSVLSFANKIVNTPADLNNVAVNGLCEIHSFKDVCEEADWVVSKIKTCLRLEVLNDIEGKLTEDRISILARNRYLLLPIEEKLIKENINYYYKNSSNGLLFDSTSGKIFNLALQIRVNPKDYLHFEQLLALLEIDDKIYSFDEIGNRVQNELYKDIIESIAFLKDTGDNFNKIIDRLLQKIQDNSEFKMIDENELHLAYNDLLEIKKNWHNYAISTKMRSIASFRNAIALGKTVQSKKEMGIALSTVHTMKGQENDIVFLIGMDDQTFPDYRSLQKGGLELEQEKNNLYVAITRAKRYLFVTYPLSRQMPWGDIKTRKISSLLQFLNPV